MGLLAFSSSSCCWFIFSLQQLLGALESSPAPGTEAGDDSPRTEELGKAKRLATKVIRLDVSREEFGGWGVWGGGGVGGVEAHRKMERTCEVCKKEGQRIAMATDKRKGWGVGWVLQVDRSPEPNRERQDAC